MKSYVQKASGAVALAALGGLLNQSEGVQAIQIQGQNKKAVENQNLLQINANINQKQGQKNKQGVDETYDEGQDNIANSSTDDMFAFSQIIAGGDKVSAVTAEMDKENKKSEKPSNDEDQAILAFSYEQPGNAGAPVAVEVDESKIAAQKQAESELADLSANDATSALAGLAMAEEQQAKVAKRNKDGANAVDETNLLQLFESNLNAIENKPLSSYQPVIAAQVSSKSSQKLDSNLVQQLQKLNLSKEQIQYISQITPGDNQQQNAAPSAEPAKEALVQSQDPTQVVQAQAEAIIEGKEDQNVAAKAKEDQKSKKEKPIDKLEKDEQPADNDDDEKVADNHRKMAKINLKKEEIRKLEDTHQALTKDALKQAKSGASMKKVQHNLKIAKSVAKRVEDLKQQVQSDQQQLQKVSNEQELDTILPFKKDTSTNSHQDVGNIPSVQDSSTGIRHSPDILGTLLATKSQLNLNNGKKHSKKYQEDIEHAKKQIMAAEEGMKSMDAEVKEFHNHMASSMQNLMKAFTEGFQALDKAKQDDKKFQEDLKQKEVNQNEHVEIADDQQVQQGAATDAKAPPGQKGKSTMLAQKEPSNKELLQIKSDNQQETINQLQAQLQKLQKQQNKRQQQENVQIKSENKQKAKTSSKLSADQFDDCDTHPADDVQKVTTEQISEDPADVEIKQKSNMLAQGKKLADTFDSSRKAKAAKKTAVKKDNKAKAKKVAAPVEQKNEAPSTESTEGQSLVEEGEHTSTNELESQAAALVEQANAMMVKNQEMAQTQGGQGNNADEQAAQQQIASLLGQLQSLQAAAQQQSATPSK